MFAQAPFFPEQASTHAAQVDALGYFLLGYAYYQRGFMSGALASPLQQAPCAPDRALAQVERAVAETLEHHAHVRLVPAVGALG